MPNVNAAAFVPTFAVPPPALPATPSEPQQQQQEQQQPLELSPKKEQAAAAPSPSKNFLKISRFGLEFRKYLPKYKFCVKFTTLIIRVSVVKEGVNDELMNNYGPSLDKKKKISMFQIGRCFYFILT